ncbi:MAG: hypothetical protein Q7T51_01625 [Candidatus Moranbacteria bacterium]|nr:hypothetical protein [Candidatus Moranbacteria bacterium]
MFESPSSAPVEKPKPILNEEGRVDDMGLAMDLAEQAEGLRNSEHGEIEAKRAGVDIQTFVNKDTDRAIKEEQESREALYEKQKFSELIGKMASSLSEEEKGFMKKMLQPRYEGFSNTSELERIFKKLL